MTSKVSKDLTQEVQIQAPRFGFARFNITGTTPYIQARFSKRAKEKMRLAMETGQRSKKGKAKSPRDFASEFPESMYISTEGWNGIPAAAFRNVMISACRIVNYKMTVAKLSLFIQSDGFDKDDGIPLVRIEGVPKPYESLVKNETGVADIRVRAKWNKWKATVCVRFDEDLFNLHDISNLMARVGMQVGIGEGRPDSKKSAGLGFGLFSIEEEKNVK